MKKMRQILENKTDTWIHWVLFSHFQVDSLATPIHLRSPHSSVLREGQNLENRLHARYFVTRHPSPVSQYQRDAHNWDTAAARNIRVGQQRSRLSDAFALHLSPRRAEQADIWMLFKSGESQLLWVKRTPEHVCSAGLLPDRFTLQSRLFTGKTVERDSLRVKYFNQGCLCLPRRRCSCCWKRCSEHGAVFAHAPGASRPSGTIQQRH